MIKDDLYRFVKKVLALYPSRRIQDAYADARLATDFYALGNLNLAVVEEIGPLYMVSGPMTSGGEGDFIQNLYKLANVGLYYQKRFGIEIYPQFLFEESIQEIWSRRSQTESVDVLKEDLFRQLYYPAFRHQNFKGVIFTPTWKTSDGATTEHGWFTDPKRVLKYDLIYASSRAYNNAVLTP